MSTKDRSLIFELPCEFARASVQIFRISIFLDAEPTFSLTPFLGSVTCDLKEVTPGYIIDPHRNAF